MHGRIGWLGGVGLMLAWLLLTGAAGGGGSEAVRQEVAEARKAALRALDEAERSRAVIAGSLAILAEHKRGIRRHSGIFLPFVEYGQRQLKWLDGALAGATTLLETASQVDDPDLRRALLRMSGPRLESALLGGWALSAWVDLLNLTDAVLPHCPPCGVETLLKDMEHAQNRMQPSMAALASMEPERLEQAAPALPELVEGMRTQFFNTRERVRKAVEGNARMLEAMQIYEMFVTLQTMRLTLPRPPSSVPVALGARLVLGADGVMVGTQVVISAEWMEGVRRLVRAGVLSVPVASAAARMQAGALLMARGDPELPQGVREALGDGPEVRAMREVGRAGAGMAEPPRHHVLPREHREWFEKRGFTGDMSIDQFCVRMEPAHHQAVHGGGNWRLGCGWAGEWNRLIMTELRDAEFAMGRPLTRSEILNLVAAYMKDYGIPLRFVSWRGR